MKLTYLQRQKIILEALLSNDEGNFLTALQLSERCQTSIKTIRNDITQLNDVFKKNLIICTKKGKGYYLKILNDNFYEKKKKYFIENDDIYDNTIQRSYFIVEKLLMNTTPIKIDDLAEELYIDRTTVSRDLKYVRDFLKKYHLSLAHKPNRGNYIIGDEIHIRVCLLDILNLNSIKKYVNIQKDMKNKIYQILSNDGISLNENELGELTLYINLLKFRVLKGHIIYLNSDEKKKLFDEYEYQVALDIWEILDEPIIEDEVCFLTAYIIGKRMNYASDIESSIFNVFPQEIEKTINAIYNYVLSIYGIDFSKDFYLKKALGIHILSMQNRIRYDTYLKNPLLKDIKRYYYLAYQISIDIWQFLYPKKETLYSEDEIAYFTIHIQYALMRNKTKNKKKILLVNSLNSSYTELLNYELLNKFDDFFEIKDSIYVSQLESVNYKDYDLILTTFPLKIEYVPTLQISSILDSNSIKKIQNFFHQDHHCSLGDYLKINNIFVLDEMHNMKDILELICNVLKSSNINVTYEELLKREEIGNNISAEFIAFPQIIIDSDSIVEIVISLKKPIVWVDSFVKKILFVSYPKKYCVKYKGFYSLLQRFILDQETIISFLSENNKENIKTFLDSYK